MKKNESELEITKEVSMKLMILIKMNLKVIITSENKKFKKEDTKDNEVSNQKNSYKYFNIIYLLIFFLY